MNCPQPLECLGHHQVPKCDVRMILKAGLTSSKKTCIDSLYLGFFQEWSQGTYAGNQNLHFAVEERTAK